MIGERLLKYRKDKGYSKLELSRLSGVSNVQIGRYENGLVTTPSKKVIEKLAKALEIPTEYLYIDNNLKIDDDIINAKFKSLKKVLKSEDDKLAFCKVMDSFIVLCNTKSSYENLI